jgi:hypothetical protein
VVCGFTVGVQAKKLERNGLICSKRDYRYERPAEQVAWFEGVFTSNFVFFASPINSICPQSIQILALIQTSATLVDINLALLGRKHTLPLDCIEPGSRLVLPHLRHLFSFIVHHFI